MERFEQKFAFHLYVTRLTFPPFWLHGHVQVKNGGFFAATNREFVSVFMLPLNIARAGNLSESQWFLTSIANMWRKLKFVFNFRRLYPT